MAATCFGADGLRLRIAWGGGAERQWRGSIEISDGTLSDPKPLGVEADEPGSMWLDGNAAGSSKLVIQQRSVRTYDSVDVLATSSPDARISVHLAADDDGADQASNLEIRLADLTGEFVSKDLDGQGNRLLAMRSPGDMLRVSFAREHLVFAPGEVFKFSLQPHALPIPEGSRIRIKAQLTGAGNKEFWAEQRESASNSSDGIAFEASLPNEEGVYDVVLAAVNNPNWSQAVRQPLARKKPIAERRVQLIVLGPQRPVPAREQEFTPLVEIDPVNPRWSELLSKLPKPRVPGIGRFLKGPLGNGSVEPYRHSLGDLMRLKPNAESPDVSWEAYSLPIAKTGQPHILEVDYPNDVAQTLGLSIVEPNAAGALMPIGLDSGAEASVDNAVAMGGSPHWQRHRLIFWPRTSAPLLLVTNGRERSAAVYGKIRLLAGGDRLSRLLPERAGQGRLLAAYLDRPLFPANFSANESLDAWSGRSLEDWKTFHEGGSRLVEYLNHAGYNGLMLAVLSDGSTIYPSAVLEPTPRYDTGVFFSSGQDPVRKDVLEMLFRLFDREDLQLIPMVEFASPLPELEAVRRAGGPEAQSIEWIGAEGTSWSAAWPSRHGLLPYYNLLNPRVQDAMLGVLKEVMGRYAQHPSFAGIAVRLSANGYAQLPGPDWGMDDATIAQLQRDTRMQVPGSGAQRFAERAAFLTAAQGAGRRIWLEWRAAQLAKFYRRAGEELAALRPHSRLYLAGAGMLSGPEMDAELRPALSRRMTLAESLLRVGIDPRHYQDERQPVVLLRPERVMPQDSLGSRAVDLAVGQMEDIDRGFRNLGVSGSLFFHQPREVRIESFDQKSPFKPSYTWLVSQPAPSGEQGRRRFIHSLATLDSQTLIDGGWMLPLGQEDALRNLIATYRHLPAVQFQTVGNRQGENGSQPVAFRVGSQGGRTYLYAANDAPFPTTARVHLEANPTCRVEEISGLREISPLQPDTNSGMYWEVNLDPYDLVAVRFSQPEVTISNPHVAWSGTVDSTLNMRIRKLGARAAALRNPPALDMLSNPGFELPGLSDGQIPEWSVANHEGGTVQLDKTHAHMGNQSIRMTSAGSVVCLVSQPLPAPTTGRLAMSVWLRAADTGQQPPLRLAFQAKLHGRDYYRFTSVGLSPSSDQRVEPIPSEWRPYVFQVSDLPLEGLSTIRVRFDLMGGGDVSIDDVQLYNMAFNQAEFGELSKLICLASVKLQNGQIGDCLQLLDGYWPQFLEENVPLQPNMLPSGVSAETIAAKPRAPEEKPSEQGGLFHRMKSMVPDALRF